MTNEQLQRCVEEVSLQYFDKPFQHCAYWNTRLKTTGGRYHLHTHHIDFNPKVLSILGIETLISVIKHELCHYHLHLSGKGYKHQDKEFKTLLSNVNGLRYVQWPKNELSYRLVYQCEGCNSLYYRNKKLDIAKYVCSKCQGKLRLNNEKKSSF